MNLTLLIVMLVGISIFGATKRLRLGACIAVLLAGFDALGDTILASKHDLSASGPGTIKATAESEVCLFCHTPHRSTGEIPLWNHTLSQAIYIPYGSSTAKATIGQPTGSSKLCLSCHDGTVALGMVNTRVLPIEMRGGISTMPPGRSNLGTDLSDDHPVSFVYDNALSAANGQLKDPTDLTGKVRLDYNHQMQCTACHDPHNNQYGMFLVQDNQASALCVACHNMDYWQDSIHRTSNKTWNGNGVNPWPHTKWTTVSANGCENCHTPHGAGGKERLLNFATGPENCFSCHDGNVAAKNVQAEFNKFSAHPILNATRPHDPVEDPINAPRHAECADCHNPHAAKSTPAVAPMASGALAGVKGVNFNGAVVNNVTKQYELCFRCHADNLVRGPSRVDRQYVQTNKRSQFATSNQSYHPVENPGVNPNVPSLLAPLTISSIIYCTDCHNNNSGPNAGGSGPNGPHGSIYSPLLEQQLVLADFQTEDYATYAMCYKCHSRNSILNDDSFKAVNALGQSRGHRYHIVDAQSACTTCHDSHGVVVVQKLMNFNVDYVTASSNGQLQYTSTGPGSGICSLTCHGFDHVATRYPVPLPTLRRGARPR